VAGEREAYAAASTCAARARALAPQSADALRALGFIAFWGSADVGQGLGLLREAVALAPQNARARHWLATALGARGAFAAALAEIEAARRLDPQSTSILADRALVQFAAGERAAGRAALEQLTEIAPDFSAAHAYLGQMDLIEGRDADFPRRLEAEGRLRGDQDAIDLSRRLLGVLRDAGAGAMRRAYAEAQQLLHRSGQISAFQVARSWAAAGDLDSALVWLGICRDRAEPHLVAAAGDVLLNVSLRGRPGFEAFRRLV